MNAKFIAWLKREIPPKQPQKRQRPPWVRKLSKVIFWLFCILGVWFATWRISLYRELEHRFEVMKTAGFPTSGEELNAWRPQVPDSKNGALVLTQAFALIRTFPDNRSNLVVAPVLLSRTNQWSTETRQMVADYVLTNAEVIAKVHEALQYQRFRFPVDFSYGPSTELPQLNHLKVLARIIALRAALTAEDDHPNDWPEDILSLLGLASTLNDEPCVISHLVRNSILRLAATTTERIMNRAIPGDDAGKKLQDAFAAAGNTNLLPTALAGERALNIPVFRMSWSEIQNANRNGVDGAPPAKPQRYSGKPMFVMWLSGIFERDLNFYLQTMDQAISLAKLPPPENLAVTNVFRNAGGIAQTNFYLFSAMLLPAFSNVARRESSTQAEIELAQVAMAAARFHNAHAKWPENLKELVPQFLDTVPMDPVDGAPLRYHLLDKGCVIYSINFDGHDDGGRELPLSKKSTDTNTYDITFTVER